MIGANDVVNEALIQTLNKINFDDEFSFNIASLNDDKLIIVSHDELSSVIDSDNYDMIESFTLTTTNININNVPTPFKVYVSTNTILDNDISLNIVK
jgi:hypothetical protein